MGLRCSHNDAMWAAIVASNGKIFHVCRGTRGGWMIGEGAPGEGHSGTGSGMGPRELDEIRAWIESKGWVPLGWS